ncbi:restriction endonuclease [Clostridium sp. DL1XJH146]
MNISNLLFNAISNFLNFLLLITIFILTLKILHYGYYVLKNYLTYKKIINSSETGEININDILDLSPFEFEHWCEIFLEKEGYIIESIKNLSGDGKVDIICKRGTETYYVECKKHNKKSKSKLIIDTNTINKLLGSMVKDEIKNGMIITTGVISKSAIQYIKTMPKEYNFKLYDGEDLIDSHYCQIENFFKNPCTKNSAN